MHPTDNRQPLSGYALSSLGDYCSQLRILIEGVFNFLHISLIGNENLGRKEAILKVTGRPLKKVKIFSPLSDSINYAVDFRFLPTFAFSTFFIKKVLSFTPFDF